MDDKNYYLEMMLEKMLELGIRPTRRQIEKDRIFNISQLKKIFGPGDWYFELIKGAEDNLKKEGYEVDRGGVVLKDGEPINQKIAKKREQELNAEIANLAAELVAAGAEPKVLPPQKVEEKPEQELKQEKPKKGEISMKEVIWSREKIVELLRKFYEEKSRVPTWEEVAMMKDWPSRGTMTRLVGKTADWYEAIGVSTPEKAKVGRLKKVAEPKEAARTVKPKPEPEEEMQSEVTRSEAEVRQVRLNAGFRMIVELADSVSAAEFLDELLRTNTIQKANVQTEVTIRIA